MKLLTPFLFLLTLILPFISADEDSELAQLPFSALQPSEYLNSTGLTEDVQWDGYSLFVKGQRIYLYSGEIHSESRTSFGEGLGWRRPVTQPENPAGRRPLTLLESQDRCSQTQARASVIVNLAVLTRTLTDSRVPNPDFYLDLMQRLKAIGFNAISHYPLWGLLNPSPGVFDLEGWKSLEPFLQAANDAGLWVVTRPGPYVVRVNPDHIIHPLWTEVFGLQD